MRTFTIRYALAGEQRERSASFPLTDDAVISIREITSVLAARHPGKSADDIRIVKWSGRLEIEDTPPL